MSPKRGPRAGSTSAGSTNQPTVGCSESPHLQQIAARPGATVGSVVAADGRPEHEVMSELEGPGPQATSTHPSEG